MECQRRQNSVDDEIRGAQAVQGKVWVSVSMDDLFLFAIADKSFLNSNFRFCPCFGQRLRRNKATFGEPQVGKLDQYAVNAIQVNSAGKQCSLTEEKVYKLIELGLFQACRASENTTRNKYVKNVVNASCES